MANTDFLEEQLPTDIRPVMSGGARFATEIKMGRSGHEHRNRRWVEPLREYSMSFSARDLDDILTNILSFAYKTAGAWLSFRMKDWIDYNSSAPNTPFNESNQSLGTGDGATYYFRMSKHYSPIYSRRIYKPTNDVKIAVNGTLLAQSEWFVDSVNGVIVFKNAPVNNAILTWGGEFDTPVRFEEDILEALTFYYQKGQTGNIGLREVRIKEDIDVAAYDTQRASM